MASTAASQPQEAPSQPSLGELTSQSPALLVVVNTAVLSISAAALGSTIGVLRQDPKNPALLLATKGAFNAAAAGFPFFACREYLVNPLMSQTSSLLHQRQQRLKTSFASPSSRNTSTQRHTNNLVSSSISGLVIGAGSGLYYGWVAAEEARVQQTKAMRVAGATTLQPQANPIHTLLRGWQAAGGIRGLGTSAARLGFLAGAVQLGVNEVGVLLGAATADDEEQPERAPPPATAATAKPSPAQTPAAPAPSPTAEPAATPPWWSPARVWPLVRLTDDEYLARLEAQRAELLAEKAQLQRDIDQVVQGGNQGTSAER